MRRFLLIATLLTLCGSAQAQTASIDWNTTFQTIQGFGAGNNFVGNVMNPYDSLLFSTLGYSLLRSAVPISNGTCDGSPSSGCATGQDSVTDMQACVSNGCTVWAYVTSPPGEYNSSGTYMCTGPSPVLNTGSYSAFATYMTNFVASLRIFQTVPLYAISVQNEPDLTCSMPAGNINAFVQTLFPTMATAGQSSTRIMIPESSLYSSFAPFANNCMGDSSCNPDVGIVAFHGYDNSYSITDPYAGTGQLFWQTEMSAGPGYGPNAPGCSGGNWCNTISDALFWADIVDNAMISGLQAWHYFWYVTPSYGAGTNEGLIDPSESPAISIRTYAIANFAKFVRPGWVRIGATHAPTGNVTVTAYKDPSGSGNFAIVAVNHSSSQAVTFPLTGFTTTTVTPWLTDATHSLASQTPISAGSSFTATLAANSVTSFVGVAGSAPPPPGSTFYIDWASGSDSNAGTSKGAPWQHAPGMTGVTGTAAAHTIAAGDNFIFKGGVTWPATAFPWQLVFTGSSSSSAPVGCAGSGCIYIGVDNTWFTGSAWTRPIFNGGNTQVGVYPGGIQSVIDLYGGYFVLDNLEWTGWWQTVNTATTWSIISIRANQTEVKNNYIHGWGHSGSATLDNARFISSGASCPPDMTSEIDSNAIDGADTTMDMGFGMGVAEGYVYNNYVADTVTLMFGTARYWFGNTLVNSGPDAFDPGSHGNVIESAGCQMIAFNNYSDGAYLGSSFFHTPVDGSIDYDFNNVLVNQDGVQAIQVDGDGLSTGTGSGIYIFNNILQEGAAQEGNPISLPSRGGTLPFATIYNNFMIATNATVNTGSHTTLVTQSNQLGITNAAASSDGYVVSGPYPYLSPSAGSPTVGTGQTNATMRSICSGIPSTTLAPASTACASDSTVGVGYNATSHTVIVPNRNSSARPSSGPWDIGSYQFGGAPPPPVAPGPPTGLVAVPF